MLSEKLKNELLEKYDKEHEYELNERFSTKGWQMVFTKPDDKDHWLVFERKSANEIEVHRTDETGFITDRDCYFVSGDKLKLTTSESYVKDRSRVSIKDNLARFKEMSQQREKERANKLGKKVRGYEI